MPFTFIIVGLILIIASARGRSGDLFNLAHDDLITTDRGKGFLPWMGAIFAVGALGYVPKLQTFSRTFLVLMIVALFLSNKGFFSKLQTALPQLFGKQGATQ